MLARRKHFSPVFIIYRHIFALANEFFAPFFQLLNLFSILFVFERKQKHFGIPREGTRFIFVPQVELFCHLGEFLFFAPDELFCLFYTDFCVGDAMYFF